MRFWIGLLLPLALLAQGTPEKKEAKTEQAAPASSKMEVSEKAVPDEGSEKVFDGYVDAGARWVSNVDGSYDTYRSIVNLGQGVRLIGLNMTINPKNSKVMDTMRVQAYNWYDPYNTLRMDVTKRGIYRYTGTYSNIAYFNAVPSFANIGLNQGAGFNQRAYDTRVRNMDNLLEILPGKTITPYAGYTTNTSYGNGVTPLVLEGNEYPLRNLVHWGQQNVFGGVRLELKRFHYTIEQGATAFKDDQSVYSTGRVYGNRSTPYMGLPLYIDQGKQLYWIRGDGPYTKMHLTANAGNWLDIYGQYLYSNPSTKSTLNQDEAGRLVYQAAFYQRGVDMFYGDARMPRTSGTGGAELRIGSRVRIRETIELDKFHNTTSGLLTSTLTTSANQSLKLTVPAADRLEATNNRNQIEGLFDLSKALTLRAGYRQEWGEGLWRTGDLNRIPRERGELKRGVFLAGATGRLGDRFNVNIDSEVGSGDKTYYRTGLMDSLRTRIQARYRIAQDLRFNAIWLYFTNENPDPASKFDMMSQQGTVGLEWMPKGSKKLMVLADYTYSMIKSDIDFIVPQTYSKAHSAYRDYANTGTVLLNITLPFSSGYAGKITAGGSFIDTHGSRESRYYQPQGRIQLPVTRKLEFFSEWRWYGLAQALYGYEGFRTHMVMTGLRFLM